MLACGASYLHLGPRPVVQAPGASYLHLGACHQHVGLCPIIWGLVPTLCYPFTVELEYLLSGATNSIAFFFWLQGIPQRKVGENFQVMPSRPAEVIEFCPFVGGDHASPKRGSFLGTVLGMEDALRGVENRKWSYVGALYGNVCHKVWAPDSTCSSRN